ncbi:hypothetical protein ACIRD8_00510 [Streptomyces sp. NPDC102451]|uniref:hypothetical protein n=1 Tax=Streptomyces sp. NPDC102451 TaxID=3366177 RepID=UPI00382F436B
MRCPARLVTGTAAAALTAAALGLAIPSAHADSLGRPEFAAAADCGAEGTAGSGTEALCEGGGTAAGNPGAAGSLGTADDPVADDPAADIPVTDIPEPADEPEPFGDLDAAEDPAAVTEPSWPDTEEPGTEEPGTEEAGTGDEAGTLRQPGTGTAPGTRPAPPDGTGPGTDPGSAKPPVPPGHRPTTSPSPSPSRPSGHVGTGVGGSAAPDTAQLAAGAGLVAAAALSGALLLRRRRAGGPRH